MADGDLTSLANIKTWLNVGQVTESSVVPAAPGPYAVAVAKAAAWNGDAGVILAASGAPLAPVAADPADGEYAVAAGVYTFNAAQAGLAVSLTYTTVTPQDALLARLVSAVSAVIQGPEGIGYPVASQDYALRLDGQGGDILVLGSKPPLVAVASVIVDGIEIPPAVTARDQGYSFSPSAIWLRGYRFTRGRGNVEVACTRGWAATPAELEQACIELVALRYKERDHIGEEATSMQGQNVTFSTRDVPNDVKMVLQGFKKVVPV